MAANVFFSVSVISSLSLGTRKNVVLCLLGPSAAFDTLKHSALVDWLRESGLQDQALELCLSYSMRQCGRDAP